MAARLEARIKDTDGNIIMRIALTEGVREGAVRSLYINKVVNAPGMLRLEVWGSTADDLYALIGVKQYPDAQIEVWRWDKSTTPETEPYIEFEGLVYIDEWRLDESNKWSYVVYAEGYLGLLRRAEILWPEESSQAFKSAVGGNVIWNYVNENIGPAALQASGRDYDNVKTGFSMGTLLAIGDSWEGDRSSRNLLDVCQEIAEATGIYFDIVGVGAGLFQFNLYENQRGRNLSRPVTDYDTGKNADGNAPFVFSTDRNNMRRITYVYSRAEEENAVTALGQGQGASQERQHEVNTDSVGLSPWVRREGHVNATNETTTQGLTDAALARLNVNRPRESVSFAPVQREYAAYGQHYWGGDRVAVLVKGNELDQIICASHLTVNKDGGEKIRTDMETYRGA